MGSERKCSGHGLPPPSSGEGRGQHQQERLPKVEGEWGGLQGDGGRQHV